VLFINASDHFEKGKRQNQLRPEDIQKILTTYQFRQEIDRYSKRVCMEDIASKHDYNLNISRYISTSAPEQTIDLLDVHQVLADLETKISVAQSKHNAFLKELGLPVLP
jgi:type I restriction enzyme M protein